ncbi:MAG: nucleoside phosphorylase [Flavobacteriia bacterium]|nr:nucleoside phosphorylase [Flavobacteriia bacterium]
MQYPESELVLTKEGKIYHLGLRPENLAHKIILVGDPNRVEIVAAYFDEIHFQTQHREFVTITGTYKKQRVSIISTGIGTDNIDIVINELDALANIDFQTREDKILKTSLDIIRIGTCGILNPKVPILSFILSEYSFGLDNVAHFYAINFDEKENQLNNQIIQHLRFPKTIQPYTTQSSLKLINQLKSDKTIQGITVTSSGFYGPQGRILRLPLSTDQMNERFSNFEYNELKINNFEMESSALSALGKALGHECTTICLGIGNRQTKEFAASYEVEMKELIKYVLDRI